MTRTTKISSVQVRNSVGSTDWQRLKSLTDNEIESAADGNPDAKRFQPQELREFKRVSLEGSNSKK